MTLSPIWSHHTEARLGGLSLAREAGLLLAWDEARTLSIWDCQGQELARLKLLFAPAAVAISEDGRHVVAVGKQGELWWLDGRLQLQFDHQLDFPPLALALESLGRYVAIAAANRRIHLLTRRARPVVSIETPQPTPHLVFVPGQPYLLAAANYGFMGCFDDTGRGFWRDGVVSYIGSLATAGEGQVILLACYSHGLRRYPMSGNNPSFVPTARPCRLACVDFDGSRVLMAAEDDSLSLLNARGQVIKELTLQETVTALVLGALGDWGAYGTARGTVTALAIPSEGEE
jgi:hypothetical protein